MNTGTVPEHTIKSFCTNRPLCFYENLIIAIAIAYGIAILQGKNNKYEVHHIVAQKAFAAIPAQICLIAAKIDINSSINKVSIKYNLHKRLHSKAYYASVNAVIVAAYGNGDENAEHRITNTLRSIKEILLVMSNATP